ncbi:hypothetical protein Zmor_001208 [Zophobas morio]|uniref:Uncharacterized protein n=1 Tax=Zophobas morio TaxID=2755281 RepID=A0AA38IYU9_9CUCU|nr:hypothetical protein Zmor_001208 [Zophobas morio]
MAVPSDAPNTIHLIRDFWPDLQFHKDDILRGNPDFIKLFYVYLINDFNEKIAFLINEDLGGDDFDNLNYDDEVKLYCKVANVFKRMQQHSLSLVDFYASAGKKMYHLVKFSIHFVIYVNNCADEVSVIINDHLKSLADFENNKMEEQQLLQTYAEIVESLAHTSDLSESLLQKLDQVKENYQKVLEHKANDERVSAQNILEMKELQSEVDYLEYELKLLEEKENELQEAVISENELEHLKETEKCLEIELQELNRDFCATWDNVTDSENVKRHEDFAKCLANLDLEALNVHNLQEIRQDDNQMANIVKTNQDELNSLNNTASDKKAKLDVLKQTLEKAQAFLTELKTKVAADEQEEKECIFQETQKCAANFEENQRIETLKIHLQEDISNLENDERRLNTAVAQEYRRILMLDKKTTTKFHKMLLDLTNRHV